MPKDEHPLIKAIRLKKEAIKKKAHPKIIENIQKRIKAEAQKSLEILKKGNLYKDKIVIKGIKNEKD